MRALSVRLASFVLGLCGLLPALQAAEVPLATLGEWSVYAQDLQADLQRIPENGRASAASDPAVVQQAAANLALRMAVAARARQDKLDQLPIVQSQLKLMEQRLLSDLWLAELERKNALPKSEIDRLAELKYQAEAFTRFKYPSQIKVSHILLSKDEDGKNRALELLGKLKAGAAFADFAKQFSKDPGSAARGGSLGDVTPGKMVPPFEQAAFALKTANELSDVVESNFGYHIIRLDQREEGKIAPFSEVKEGLIQEVTTKATADARNAAMAELFSQIKLSKEATQQFVDAAKAAKR